MRTPFTGQPDWLGQVEFGDDRPPRAEAPGLVRPIEMALDDEHRETWPGSWHRKAEPRLCRIADLRADAEVNLVAALAKLKDASSDESQAGPSGREEQKGEKDGASTEPTAEQLKYILSGESYHPALTPLAACLLGQGMYPGSVVNFLTGLMDGIPSERRDLRWIARRAEIPLLVSTAQGKWGANEPPASTAPVDI